MAEIEERAIGFIGLGNMGQPMVRRLAGAGMAVHVYDRDAATMAALESVEGVTKASDAAGVAATAEVVILMLPDSQVVNAVTWGGDPATVDAPAAGALAAELAPGSVVIDMSSSFPLATRTLGTALATRDLAMADAPVSGGVAKAVTGELAIIAGGETQTIDRVAPLLAPMGTVHRAGALGAGHAAKALNNYVSAAGLIATSEALAAGAAFGLEPTALVDILNASTGRNNTTENKAARFMLSGTYNSGFAFALMQKDVGMARKLADALGLELGELTFVSDQLDAMAARLDRTADHTEVHRLVTEQLAQKA